MPSISFRMIAAAITIAVSGCGRDPVKPKSSGSSSAADGVLHWANPRRRRTGQIAEQSGQGKRRQHRTKARRHPHSRPDDSRGPVGPERQTLDDESRWAKPLLRHPHRRDWSGNRHRLGLARRYPVQDKVRCRHRAAARAAERRKNHFQPPPCAQVGVRVATLNETIRKED